MTSNSSSGGLGAAIATNRILASRLFGIAFLAVLLTSGSAHGGIASTLIFLVALVLASVAIVGRLWCSMYISGYKDSSLITTGPYSMSRNPLYFFSLLGFAGVGFASGTLTLGFVMAAAFLIAYPSVIAREEAYLRNRHGAAFDEYCARVPRLFPKRALFREPETWQVNPRLFRRTMFDVVWFVWFVAIVRVIAALHENGVLKPLFLLP